MTIPSGTDRWSEAGIPVLHAGCAPAAILPLLFFLLVLFASARAADRRNAPRRDAFLRAFVAWGVAIWAGTEIMSLFHLLTRPVMIGYWTALCAGAAAWIARKELAPVPSREPTPMLALSDLAPLGLAGALLAALGFIAAIAAPNNWDSITYHLSRVCHWIQNGDVTLYATHITRQDFLQPWAEYAILHLTLLAGSDRLDNLVQWVGLAGTLLALSLLAARSGAGRTGQIFAAVFFCTLPMAVLQSTSTQNILVLCLWLACFIYFSLVLADAPGPVPAFFAGASLGLALLTHATAYLYAAPWIIGLVVLGLRRRNARFLVFLSCAGALAFVINTGYWTRNLGLFGHVMGPGQGNDLFGFYNETHGWKAMLSVVLRNIGPHLVIPEDGWPGVADRAIHAIHRALNIDPNDSRTTWRDMSFHINVPCTSENCAANPAQFILLLTTVLLSALRRRPRAPLAGAIALAGVAGFLLFCFLLKWQPWHPRLHLPWFALAAPWVATVWDLRMPRRAAGVAACLLVALAVGHLLHNPTRLLTGDDTLFTVPRVVVYFGTNPRPAVPFGRAAQWITKSHASPSVGIVMTEDEGEYLFWMLFRAVGAHPRIEHVLVNNETAALERPGFRPDALLSTRWLTGPELQSLGAEKWEVRDFVGLVAYKAPSPAPGTR